MHISGPNQMGKVSKYIFALVGSINLCLKEPDSTQNESAQIEQPVQRKRPKHAEILEYFDVGQKEQNQTKFWTFSHQQLHALVSRWVTATVRVAPIVTLLIQLLLTARRLTLGRNKLTPACNDPPSLSLISFYHTIYHTKI